MCGLPYDGLVTKNCNEHGSDWKWSEVLDHVEEDQYQAKEMDEYVDKIPPLQSLLGLWFSRSGRTAISFAAALGLITVTLSTTTTGG